MQRKTAGLKEIDRSKGYATTMAAMTDTASAALIITDNKKFRRLIRPGASSAVNLPNGSIPIDQVMAIGPGGSFTISEKRYFILECDVYDAIMEGIRRQTQIIYPKDAGYILLRLDVSAGKSVGEAGTGSGGLTMILAKAVGKQGRVYSYEKNANLAGVIGNNLQPEEAYDHVRIRFRAVEEGILETGLDAFFLDVRDPSPALAEVHRALRPGGHLGVLVPTANQVIKLLWALQDHPFLVSEVCETSLRAYKPNPSRLRPADRMVGHTGYLVFARALRDRHPPAAGENGTGGAG